MRHSNTIGVDLAKNVIQVSVVSPFNKELSNKELSRAKFAEFLAKPGKVAFEGPLLGSVCGQTWPRSSFQRCLLPPSGKAIKPIKMMRWLLQKQLIAQTVAPLKSIEQQAMQSIQRSRELIIHDRTAISNHIRRLLLEFGIVIPKVMASLRQRVPLALEDNPAYVTSNVPSI